ncbi:hypothetical protein NEF87_003786 [Candidatus Lokiarchaeum ossiferum]|uniref:TFIIB-type domain-containing protein n=1 Tax=Candidatus Lokiarchaeum ossiferum TaxID=2951803 RepID=A0ABY6HVE9_9ARCH|nr:hypothetical protein NEF87_003786 [Candidatus Lokiarchaeum sp. B-35]
MKKNALPIGEQESDNGFFCDCCGSSSVFHDEFGHFVCHDCGLCCEDPVINASLAPLNKNREGILLMHHSTKIGEGTLIGSKKERSSRKFARLSRLQNICNTTPKDSAYIHFNQLCAEFDIVLDMSLFMNLFEKLFHKMPACTKARNISKFCTTLFIIVCRKFGQDFEIKKVLDFAQMGLKDYYAIRRPIHNVEPNTDRLSVKDLENFSVKLISRLVDQYELGFTVFRLTKHLIRNYRQYLGEKVRIIAGSALIVALEYLKHPIKLSAFQISKDLGVSASTVYTRKKQFPMEKLQWNSELEETKTINLSPKLKTDLVGALNQNVNSIVSANSIIKSNKIRGDLKNPTQCGSINTSFKFHLNSIISIPLQNYYGNWLNLILRAKNYSDLFLYSSHVPLISPLSWTKNSINSNANRGEFHSS